MQMKKRVSEKVKKVVIKLVRETASVEANTLDEMIKEGDIK